MPIAVAPHSAVGPLTPPDAELETLTRAWLAARHAEREAEAVLDRFERESPDPGPGGPAARLEAYRRLERARLEPAVRGVERAEDALRAALEARGARAVAAADKLFVVVREDDRDGPVVPLTA